MKQLFVSGGLLAGDVLVHLSEVVSRPEAPEMHSGLFALGLLGLLLSLLQFGRATAGALLEHGETFDI